MTDLDSLDSVLGNDDGEASNLPLETPTNEAPGDELDTDAPPAPETPKAEDPPAKKPDEESEESWTKRAVLDERRKRQELEREIADLRAKAKPDAVPEKPSRPDIFEDQEGAFGHLEKAFEARLATRQIELSQELMREKYADYDEKESLFVDLVKADPSLIQKMRAAALPAKFVYDHVTKHQQMQEMQDVDAYREKIRAEVRAELEKERGEEAEPAARETQPPQLVGRRSATKAPVAHESLEDILGR
jgi:hypothetical protein